MSWKDLIETEKDFNPEQLSSFLNTTITSTIQTEYYSKPNEQTTAIFNSHNDLMESNREIYALTLLLPINDLHKQLIIYNLLKSGKGIPKEQKIWENKIIATALRKMPSNRSYKVFTILKRNKVNNARTRWLAKYFLDNRKNLEFEAVKYKRWMKNLIIHNHINPNGFSDIFKFLFEKNPAVKSELFKTVMEAKTNREAVFKLPYSIAIGYKDLHKIPDKEFYEKIQGQLSQSEKLRLQETAKKADVKIEANLAIYEPIKLLKYLRLGNVGSYPIFEKSAKRMAEKIPFSFGDVAIIVDNSPSMYGSYEKKFHPISVAEAISEIMKNVATKTTIYQTSDGKEIERAFLLKLAGSSDLGTALINALKKKPETLIIISDGYENSPAGLAHQILQAYLAKSLGKTMILHINPVYAPETKDIKALHSKILTMGIRDSSQLSLVLLIALSHFRKTKEIQKVLVQLRKEIMPLPERKKKVEK